VTVQLETPVLLYWSKVSEVEEWGEREGGHGKEGGRSSFTARLKSLPREIKGAGRRQLSCRLREMLIPVQK